MNEYKFFRALGDKTRYKIVLSLLDAKKNNCIEIAKVTKKDASTISRQLKILENEKIITVKKIKKNKCIELKDKKKILNIINNIKKIRGDLK